MGGQAVYGALRASAMSMAEDYLAHGGDDWSVNESVSFELEPEGEAVRAVKETLTALNGLTVVNLRPQTVYLPDSAALVPIGAGARRHKLQKQPRRAASKAERARD